MVAGSHTARGASMWTTATRRTSSVVYYVLGVTPHYRSSVMTRRLRGTWRAISNRHQQRKCWGSVYTSENPGLDAVDGRRSHE